jgi:fructose-1-phosphate kinase PfkB-like protein
LIDRATGTSTELIENAARVPPADLELFRMVFQTQARQADFVVLTGSLPAGTPDSYFAELTAGLPARVILDARGPSLLAALAQNPLVVKPNREELQQTLGRPLDTDAELHRAMRELNRRGAEWVLVTQGKNRVWLSSATELYHAEPPEVVPVNAIASGDCLTAGLAWAFDRGIPMPHAVRFGMAAAADNLRQLLYSRLDARYVEEVAATIRIESARMS